jgi:TolB-like protein
MKTITGYVCTFMALQYALMVLTEYVCPDGHRIRVRVETIDWQSKNFIWG